MRMKNALQELYDHFYTAPKITPQERRVRANHQRLIQRLKKPERKLVLRIIDDKDLICEDVSLDSFICGFRLSWQIITQLNNYENGHLAADHEVRPDARSVFQKEEAQ